jgi:glycosyltransferase involved in cell wall biosynthesis
MDGISVIIPTYNHAATLIRCIDSVLAQSLLPSEIIIVNDGSTDETRSLLSPYEADDRFTIIHQQNMGANPARNRGLQEARGQFVIFVDADVIMEPHMLEAMHNQLNRSDVSFCYSAFRFGGKLFRGVPFNPEKLKTLNYIHTTSLARREHHPGFDNAIKRLQDWDVWLTMVENGGKGVLIDEVLFTVLTDGPSRIGSQWLPSMLYEIPWPILGYTPKAIQKYEAAKKLLLSKHNL